MRAGFQLRTLAVLGMGMQVLPVFAVEAFSSAAGTGTSIALPASSVTAEQILERADGPVPGFVARQAGAATKTDTPIQETPQSISVIGREQLDDRNVTDLNQALRYTAGVNTSYSNDTRNDAFTLRGFSADFFYLDGTRLPAVPGRALDQFRVDPYQLERIEVLKGPAAVLYGQGEPGGVVNMVSKRPTDYARGQVDAQVGSHDRYQLGVDVSGPVEGNDNILYRVIAQETTSRNEVDSVHGTRTLLAPSLTFRLGEATSLSVMAGYLRDDTMDSNNFLPYYGTVHRTHLGQRIPTRLATSNPSYENYDKTQYSLAYLLEHAFDEDWSFRQNFRYSHVDLDNQALFGYALSSDQQTIQRAAMNLASSFNNFDFDNQVQGHLSTGEVDHTLLMGLNLTTQNFYDSEGYDYGYALNLYDPTALRGSIAKPDFNDTRTHQVQTQTGLYLQDQMKLDNWVLVVSGRQDWVSTTSEDNLADTRQDSHDDAFSGRVGLMYEFESGLAPYLSYSTSFQPVLGSGAGGTPYSPLKSKQWEAGLKYQPPGMDATFSAAAFDLRQDNTLTDSPDPSVFTSVQQGQIRSRGLEFEATAELTRNLKLLGAYTLQNVEVTKGGPTDVAVGNAPTATPRHLGSLWLDYTLHEGPFSGLGFGAGAQYVGSTYANAANTLRVDSFAVLDAAVHYDVEDWRFVLSGNNLLDKQFVSRCGSATRCQYGDRAEVLLSARRSW
ncbi:TonB-dependent siderophore receptor [Pseudomonas sp. UBA6562]|uniref:TonB-dependent siderophore receptor n=1 Tax=Pseudomonas sp. UBA6562 TaxID=1947332 RepID=UPI0025FFA492|nr:TonB-dependent siderophore receptor [Pseudomonas sp. UBA6562]